MEIRKIIFYVQQIIIAFPCLLFHELCHYIWAVISFYLLQNSFPYIKIDSYPKFYRNDMGTNTTIGASASVNFSTSNKNNLMHIIGTAMPAVGTICLFIFSPWYIWIYYIAGLDSLWLSLSDSDRIVKYFKIKRRLKKINKWKKKNLTEKN